MSAPAIYAITSRFADNSPNISDATIGALRAAAPATRVALVYGLCRWLASQETVEAGLAFRIQLLIILMGRGGTIPVYSNAINLVYNQDQMQAVLTYLRTPPTGAVAVVRGFFPEQVTLTKATHDGPATERAGVLAYYMFRMMMSKGISGRIGILAQASQQMAVYGAHQTTLRALDKVANQTMDGDGGVVRPLRWRAAIVQQVFTHHKTWNPGFSMMAKCCFRADIAAAYIQVRRGALQIGEPESWLYSIADAIHSEVDMSVLGHLTMIPLFTTPRRKPGAPRRISQIPRI